MQVHISSSDVLSLLGWMDAPPLLPQERYSNPVLSGMLTLGILIRSTHVSDPPVVVNCQRSHAPEPNGPLQPKLAMNAHARHGWAIFAD